MNQIPIRLCYYHNKEVRGTFHDGSLSLNSNNVRIRVAGDGQWHFQGRSAPNRTFI